MKEKEKKIAQHIVRRVLSRALKLSKWMAALKREYENKENKTATYVSPSTICDEREVRCMCARECACVCARRSNKDKIKWYYLYLLYKYLVYAWCRTVRRISCTIHSTF